MELLFLSLWASVATAWPASINETVISVPPTSSATPGLLQSYVSLSYELDAFPAFAEYREVSRIYASEPRRWQLTACLSWSGDLAQVCCTDTSSRDRAIYDSELVTATAPSCGTDPTAILCIGPSFFDSYGAFPRSRYSHGFNLAWNNASGFATLQETVPLACKAIGPEQLDAWEYGNEPDLYIGKWRPQGWNASDYVQEWVNGTKHIHTYLRQSCPELASSKYFRLLAPSVSSPGSQLAPSAIIAAGEQGRKHPIGQFSVHNYITGATIPGVTLQNTLMNHTRTVESIAAHVQTAMMEEQSAGYQRTPYILGECNSLYGGGAEGLSNVFGAALWVLDFTLYGASTGSIHRMHYHQSVGAPYSAWVPTGSNASTQAPYYGKIAAAAFLKNSEACSVSAITLPGQSDTQSAYASYDVRTKAITALAVINMNQYNSSESTARPSAKYSFQVPAGTRWQVSRLTAAGADVQSGVTFGGVAYEYSTLGNPLQVSPCEADIFASSGILSIDVQDSEAAVLRRRH